MILGHFYFKAFVASFINKGKISAHRNSMMVFMDGTCDKCNRSMCSSPIPQSEIKLGFEGEQTYATN